MKNNHLFSLPSLGRIGIGDGMTEEASANNVIMLEKRRTTVDLSARLLSELDWLANGPEVKKRSEALRESLYLFWMLAGMESKEMSIFICDENGSNSLFVPTLNAINGIIRSSSGPESHRLTLELPTRSLLQIEALREYTGESKIADVIRQAIHLNWVLANEINKGRSIQVHEKDGLRYDLFIAEADEENQPEPGTFPAQKRRR